MTPDEELDSVISEVRNQSCALLYSDQTPYGVEVPIGVWDRLRRTDRPTLLGLPVSVADVERVTVLSRATGTQG